MTPDQHVTVTNAGKVHPVVNPQSHATKRSSKEQTRKREDELLNATNPPKSSPLSGITHRNSTHSPLLRLPGEIRNMIWELALGGNTIYLSALYDMGVSRLKFSHLVAQNKSFPTQDIKSCFQLPKACRQLQVETSPILYSHNTFRFDDDHAMYHWMRKLMPVQYYSITSIDIPYTYMWRYRNGSYKGIWTRFPSLKQLGVDSRIISGMEFTGKTRETRKLMIVQDLRLELGSDVEIHWF